MSAPAPFAKLTEPVIAHVDQATINGGGTVSVSAADKKLPNLTILKRDSQTGDVIPNTHFEIRGIHYGYHNDVTTGPDGKAVLTAIPSDSYEVTEKSVPDPWVVGDEPTQTIWLEAGDDKQLIFDNMKQPLLKITKVEKGTTPAVYIPETNFLIEAIDGDGWFSCILTDEVRESLRQKLDTFCLLTYGEYLPVPPVQNNPAPLQMGPIM